MATAQTHGSTEARRRRAGGLDEACGPDDRVRAGRAGADADMARGGGGVSRARAALMFAALVALCACAWALYAPDSWTRSKKQRFCSWHGEGAGIIIGPVAPRRGPYGWGLVPTEDIPEGGLVASVPYDCMLSIDWAFGTELAVFLREAHEGGDPRLAIVAGEEQRRWDLGSMGQVFSYQGMAQTLMIMRELRLGRRSGLASWIAHLPPRDSQNSLVMWREEELQWLNGTLAGAFTRQARGFLADFHKKFAPILEAATPTFLGPPSMTLEELTYAFALGESRMFMGSPFGGEERELVVVPLLELANHCHKGGPPQITLENTANKGHRPRGLWGGIEDRKFVMRASKGGVKAGAEVCFEYTTQRSSAWFLFSFGFAEAYMPGAILLALHALPRKLYVSFPEDREPLSHAKIVEEGKGLPVDLMCALRMRALPDEERRARLEDREKKGLEWCEKPLEDAEHEREIWKELAFLFEHARDTLARNISAEGCPTCSPVRLELARNYLGWSRAFAERLREEAEAKTLGSVSEEPVKEPVKDP